MEKSVTCGLGMLELQSKKKNRLFSQESYLEVLRPLRYDQQKKKWTDHPKTSDIMSGVKLYCGSIAKDTTNVTSSIASK